MYDRVRKLREFEQVLECTSGICGDNNRCLNGRKDYFSNPLCEACDDNFSNWFGRCEKCDNERPEFIFVGLLLVRKFALSGHGNAAPAHRVSVPRSNA